MINHDGRLTIEIEVVKSKLTQSLIERGLDVFRSVRVVPELGGNKEVLAFAHGRNDLLQGSPYLAKVVSTVLNETI